MPDDNMFQPGAKKGSRASGKKSQLEKINLVLYHWDSRRKLMEKLMNPSLSLEETSLLLDIAKSTIRNYTKSGILACVRTPGGQRRFYLSEIVKFALQRDGDSVMLDWMLETENLIRQAQARITSKKKLAGAKEIGATERPPIEPPHLESGAVDKKTAVVSESPPPVANNNAPGQPSDSKSRATGKGRGESASQSTRPAPSSSDGEPNSSNAKKKRRKKPQERLF